MPVSLRQLALMDVLYELLDHTTATCMKKKKKKKKKKKT